MNKHLLNGTTISISIGNAPDMQKLGYPSREVDRVLFTVCGSLIRAGARIAYGGNLETHGYTVKIFRYLAKAYTVRQTIPPFIHYIPESVLFTANYDDIYHLLHENRDMVESVVVYQGKIAGTLVALDNGQVGICWAKDFSPNHLVSSRIEIIPKNDTEQSLCYTRIFGNMTPVSEALTQMRKIMTAATSARIVMGGKMGLLNIPTDHYQGNMPGVVEEALLTLEANKPIIVLGAFGGAARDIAIALDLLPKKERVARDPQLETYQKTIDSIAMFKNQLQRQDLEVLKELASIDRAETIGHKIVEYLHSRQAVRDQSRGIP